VEWLKVKALSSNSSTGVGGTLKYSKITACPSKVIMRHYRTDSLEESFILKDSSSENAVYRP
jgi:hypothetical protein